jgi:hypothetical protein
MLRKFGVFIPFTLGAAILLAALFAWNFSEANAQCGSQASSCKNCHEVQGQDPVNNDGTGWHESHAFGDFCYICHAGNQQATDKDAAHTGMVPPLSDVKASCQQCHPNDLMDRAKVYATALGVEVNTGDGAGPSNSSGPTEPNSGGSDQASQSDNSAQPSSSSIVVDDNTVDYNQIYDQTVLGKNNTNWGNVIVAVTIFCILVGGSAFAYLNERKLSGAPLLPAKKAAANSTLGTAVPTIEGYSPEVLSLLPELNRLTPQGLYALKRLLASPEDASELLYSLSRLDPELVRRVRAMDRDSRALLLGLANN